jgi:hypothetical protein
MEYETVYFAGYAKFPSVMSASVAFGQLSLGLLIDMRTGVIVDAGCTLVTDLAKEIVRGYFVGRHIVNDYARINEEITYCHQGNAQRPILKAFGDVYRKYLDFVQVHPGSVSGLDFPGVIQMPAGE